jgi:hypothetical protein
MYKKFSYLFAVVAAAGFASAYGAESTTCDTYTKEDKCLAGSEGSEHCSWCSSGAVGKSCMKESDAKSLPTSVFSCTYVSAYGAEPATCDTYTKEDKCLAGSEGSEHCSWCSSGAVGKSCMKESDAKSLPTSVFSCEYAKTFLTSTTCDSYTNEKNCMVNSEGTEKCSWCSSAAAGKLCLKQSDAKTLPSSVFACEYSSSNLRALLRM